MSDNKDKTVNKCVKCLGFIKMWSFLLFVLSGDFKGSHFSCHPWGISEPFWHIGGQEMYQWGPSFIIFFYTTHSHVYANTLSLRFHVCVCCSFWYACMCDNGSMKCPHILTISFASTFCNACVSLSNLSRLIKYYLGWTWLFTQPQRNVGPLVCVAEKKYQKPQ